MTIEYEFLDDVVYVIDDEELDPDGNPVITEMTLEEYNQMINSQ